MIFFPLLFPFPPLRFFLYTSVGFVLWRGDCQKAKLCEERLGAPVASGQALAGAFEHRGGLTGGVTGGRAAASGVEFHHFKHIT